MSATDLSIIIGAFFTGFGTLIYSVGKAYVAIKGVGQTQDRNDALIEKKILALQEEMNLRQNKTQNDIETILRKSVWFNEAPKQVEAIVNMHLEKVKNLRKDQDAMHAERMRSTKEWLTSEWVRITNVNKGENK